MQQLEIRQCTSSLETELENTPGVYAFFLSPLSPHKVGLWRTNHSNVKANTIRTRILRRAARYLKLMRKAEWSGTLRVASGLSDFDNIGLNGTLLTKELRIDPNEDLDVEGLRKLAEVINLGFILRGPIYVGVTEQQTIRMRYTQHKAAYLYDTEAGSFGKRVKDLGIEWNDLSFGYISLTEIDHSLPSISEQALLALCAPMLSER